MTRLALSLLMTVAAATAAPAAAGQDGPVRAYTCFIAYSAEISNARSDASRAAPAAAARRISLYLESLDLDRDTQDTAVAAGRQAWLNAADKAALRRTCDTFVETLPARD